MIKELLKLANHLDAKGLAAEAGYLDGILRSAAEPSYEMETNPDWTWEEEFWDPNDEGYNDPQGLLETGEAKKSLSDPEFFSELEEPEKTKREDPYWRDQDDLRTAAKRFFNFMDKNEDGAIDSEEHLALWEAVVSIAKEVSPDATNEEIVDIVLEEMNKAESDEVGLSNRQKITMEDEWLQLARPGGDFGELGHDPERREAMREHYSALSPSQERRLRRMNEEDRAENLVEDELESS
jgi:Ca2+-binding EF-hand superfamily protein